ncbi:glycosyltransferase family 4 protein [Paenibacillus senegalensis]|uniref:glycosyltransferase family 4 protein n=1 Tax=Paenibacillus senegalensis TaxID=1465766 RepID=UPI00028840C9|nr:glycosyltransferase family 1 protein [Paenibacillus senegalensis]
MVTVYINGRFLTQSTTGVQRVAIEVVKSLDDLIADGVIHPDCSFKILAPKHIKQQLSLRHIPIMQVGRLTGHAWEQIELPLYSGGNLLLNLCGPAPLLKRKQIVTIHDAAVFANSENFSAKFTAWYRFLFRSLKYRSKKWITVSQFSKDELQKYVRIREQNISVYHLGADHMEKTQADPRILQKHELTDGGYILAVSSKSPNKNFGAIIQSLELLQAADFQCVIVGGAHNPVFQSGKAGVTASSRVKFIGYVTDEELKALYEHAACFVFPSFYEGFGLPPVEAMACGCPVIAAESASIPEVCGSGALYCNPYQAEDIADKIKLLLHNDPLRRQLRQTGQEHAAQYRWRKTASGICTEIENLLYGGGTP